MAVPATAWQASVRRQCHAARVSREGRGGEAQGGCRDTKPGRPAGRPHRRHASGVRRVQAAAAPRVQPGPLRCLQRARTAGHPPPCLTDVRGEDGEAVAHVERCIVPVHVQAWPALTTVNTGGGGGAGDRDRWRRVGGGKRGPSAAGPGVEARPGGGATRPACPWRLALHATGTASCSGCHATQCEEARPVGSLWQLGRAWACATTAAHAPPPLAHPPTHLWPRPPLPPTQLHIHPVTHPRSRPATHPPVTSISSPGLAQSMRSLVRITSLWRGSRPAGTEPGLSCTSGVAGPQGCRALCACVVRLVTRACGVYVRVCGWTVALRGA